MSHLRIPIKHFWNAVRIDGNIICNIFLLGRCAHTRTLETGYQCHLSESYCPCNSQEYAWLSRNAVNLKSSINKKMIDICQFCQSRPFSVHSIHVIITSIGHAIQWHHNERDDVWNHRCPIVYWNRLFRYRSKTTSKLRATDLCEGNSPVTDEFPTQRVSNAEMSLLDDVFMGRFHLGIAGACTIIWYRCENW